MRKTLGMYFDVSEHIAHKTDFSKADIKRIDSFLAYPNLRRFELRNVQDNTDIYENAEAILDEYIQRGVIVKKREYFCPIHDIFLEPVNTSEGKCIDCEKRHSFENCESEIIYERKKAPDRVPAQEATTQLVQNETSDSQWWKDKKWLTDKAIQIVGIISVLVVGGVGVVVNISLLLHETPTPTAGNPTMTTVPTSSATATITITPTSLSDSDLTLPPIP